MSWSLLLSHLISCKVYKVSFLQHQDSSPVFLVLDLFPLVSLPSSLSQFPRVVVLVKCFCSAAAVSCVMCSRACLILGTGTQIHSQYPTGMMLNTPITALPLLCQWQRAPGGKHQGVNTLPKTMTCSREKVTGGDTKAEMV